MFEKTTIKINVPTNVTLTKEQIKDALYNIIDLRGYRFDKETNTLYETVEVSRYREEFRKIPYDASIVKKLQLLELVEEVL